MKRGSLILSGIIVLIALTFFIVHYKEKADKFSKNLEVERYSRLVAEEKVVNTVSKIRQLENDLRSSEDKIAKVQSVLKEQRTFNNELELQFQRLSKVKIELEEKLQEAIVKPEEFPVQTVQPLQANETVQTPN